ncbi:hypothetical protein [Propionivibrio soli]|uniref:hypothetical protein n=1 Tax=Propionivibrio soli TaxID=2976531 RepID=UPI0021E85FC1|nr:hypothetical protein [Propionivibrio soli]
MNWVHETLAEFGRQIGLTGFAPGTHGVAQLRLESGGLLAVEAVTRGSSDEVLVYLGQPMGFDADRLRMAALEKVRETRGGPYAIQVATRGDGPQAMLLMLVRVPERQFTVQTLGQAVDYLGRWFADLAASR